MKKIICIMLVLLVCLAASACTEKVVETEPGTLLAQQDSSLKIINPVKQMSRQELVQACGIDLGEPEGAAELRYSLIELEDAKPVAQLHFEVDGQEFCLRAQDVGSEAARDISGMYYEWELTEYAYVENRYAVVYIAGDAGYIKWLDLAPGIQYSLSVTQGADRELLLSMAESVFMPLQENAG